MTLQAITVQQPWATMIALGHKLVENRARDVWRAGELLAIHAGGRWSARGARDERVARALLGGNGDPEPAVARLVRAGIPRRPDAFPAGAVIATALHLGSHPDDGCCRPWGESLYPEGGGRIKTGIVHVRLGDVRALPRPVPCPGSLGRWLLPPDADAEVRALWKEMIE